MSICSGWPVLYLVEFLLAINMGEMDMIGMFAVAGVRSDGSWDIVERFQDRPRASSSHGQNTHRQK